MIDPELQAAQLAAHSVLETVPNVRGRRISVMPSPSAQGIVTYLGVGMDGDADVFVHQVGGDEGSTMYLSPDAARVLAQYLNVYAGVADAWANEKEVPVLS